MCSFGHLTHRSSTARWRPPIGWQMQVVFIFYSGLVLDLILFSVQGTLVLVIKEDSSITVCLPYVNEPSESAPFDYRFDHSAAGITKVT